MKITFSELENWEEEYILKKFKAHKISFIKSPINYRNINQVKDSNILAVFIYSELNSKILSKFPKLKFIITMSTGFDHIDMDYCKKKRIKVSNIPYYGENTVAEHTIALILTLSRKINKSIEHTKNDNFSLKGLMGFDLRGKTLGVVGVGHIGRHVVNIAHGFGMNVVAYSKNRGKKLSKKLGLKFISFNDLLKRSHIITFHVPLNTETKHMINMSNISKIKKGAYIINTSRGGVIDTRALLYGLNNNILSGAGLDVLEGEENIKEEKSLLRNGNERDWKTLLQNHLLLKDKNVIITPHCAFYTREALERILDAAIDDIRKFLGKKVRNRIV